MDLSSEIIENTDKILGEMTKEQAEKLGDAYLSRGNFHLAYLEYEKALEQKPENIRLEYKKGLTLLMAGKTADAIKQFEKVIQKDSTYAPAFEGLGRSQFLNKNYQGAETNLKKAVDLNAKLWLAHVYLGQVEARKKNHVSAIEQYQKAVAIKPNRGSLYNDLGFLYFSAGKYPEAVDAYQAAVNRGYTKGKVYNNMALAYAAMGRYDESLACFKKSVGDARAYNNLGAIYLETGNYKKAADCFEKAVAAAPIFYVDAHDRLQTARKKMMDVR
jgi:tetratricopeptide (TPR) repeat protein